MTEPKPHKKIDLYAKLKAKVPLTPQLEKELKALSERFQQLANRSSIIWAENWTWKKLYELMWTYGKSVADLEKILSEFETAVNLEPDLWSLNR